MRVLSQALNRAEAKEYISRNVASAVLVRRPAGKRREFVVIDAAMANEILGAATGEDPWDAAVHLALGLGLRREEALALEWGDDDGGVLHIRRALTAASGELHVGEPKSAAGRRDLPVPGFVAAALRRHRKAQVERLLAIGTSSQLVIDNGIGELWQPATFSGAWRDWSRAQGFDLTFHNLRHGAATLLLAAGVPDAVAISVLGHADTKILRRYQDVVSELQRDAAERMDSMLGGGR